MKRGFLGLAVILCTLFALPQPPLEAQTYTQVARGDSMLLITKAPQCTSACPESVFVTWKYGSGDRRLFHVFRSKGTDTTVVKRGLTGSVKAKPAFGVYKRVEGPELVVPSMPVDTTFEYFANGVISKTPISIVEGDSMRAVVYLKIANGMKLRPGVPVVWTYDDSVLAMRSRTDLRDTVWFIGK